MRLDLRIDFTGRRRIGWPGLALLAAGAACALWQASAGWTDYDQLQRHREGLRGLERAAQARPAARLTPEDVRRHQAIDAVVTQLAMPWQPLFDHFETLARPDVLLTQWRPDALSGQIEMAVQARDAEAAGRWLDALVATEAVDQLAVLRHDWSTEKPAVPLRVHLKAHWRAVAAGTPVAAARDAADTAPDNGRRP